MNVPSGLTGKVWGQTQSLFYNPTCEVHLLAGKKGGYCSKHHHVNKWNRFFVISGQIKVTIYREETSGYEDVIIVGAGQFTDVKPGLKHRFEVLEDCQCIEIYWTNDLDPVDIVREDNGGIRSE